MTPQTDPRVQRTHREVHAAVLALLSEDGLDAVRHARVAERSGVSRATLYRHWPDRAALLVSALEAMRPDIDPPPLTGDVRVDAPRLLRVLAGHLNSNEMLAEMLVLLRQADDDPDFAVVRDHLFPVTGNPVVALVAAGRAAGQLHDDLPIEVAVATLVGPLLALRVLLGRTLTDQLVDGVTAAWLDGHAAAPRS